MNTETFETMKFQPTFHVRADGIYAYESFEMLHDRAFVRAIYLAILQREPDPDGEMFYLQQLRSGFSKARLLDIFLRSDEAKTKSRTVVNGLAAQLRWIRVCEIPLLGRLVVAILFLAGINEHMRSLRILENHVIRLAEEIENHHAADLRKIRSLIK